MNWWVYIILCDNDSLYTGITTDPERRYREHTMSRKGAKFFRNTTPIALVFLENCANRSLASQREYAIKKLSRRAKQTLVQQSAANSYQCYHALGLDAVNTPYETPAFTPHPTSETALAQPLPA